MLIDDSAADNRFHQLLIEEMNITETIQTAENALEAIKFLKDESQIVPELILLDINMPKMNGWEFIKEYKKLDVVKKNYIVLIILASLTSPDEINRAPAIDMISKFELKPLTKRKLNDIIQRYFSDREK